MHLWESLKQRVKHHPRLARLLVEMARTMPGSVKQNVLLGSHPQGQRGIELLGHRTYVGGNWDQIGRLQLDFLVARGLTPADVLLDIGCGALRGGVHLIPYLEPGHYLGLDRESILIEKGIDEELGRDLYLSRAPELIVSDSFEFSRFSKRPTFALAQSLFTHLTEIDIDVCIRRLTAAASEGCRLFASFTPKTRAWSNPPGSHSLRDFRYSTKEMAAFGERHGWTARYIGEWGHPFGLMMMEFVAP